VAGGGGCGLCEAVKICHVCQEILDTRERFKKIEDKLEDLEVAMDKVCGFAWDDNPMVTVVEFKVVEVRNERLD
jgi:hypothetical protein